MQKKWQEKWAAAKCFEPQPSGEKKFFFTVPYPYVSGLLHVGHGRTYTNGDVIARFKRMQGYNVLWPMAFHITGTPVLAVSSKIAAGDEATIKMFEEYVAIYEKESSKIKKIVASFKDPWKLVNYFSIKLVDDFSAMGFSLDLSRQFTTGDKEYNKFIEWQFHCFKGKGYLKQAAYPLLYCVRDENAVGEDDIKDADTVPVEVQRFTAFKFKLEGSSSFVVSSTLRPDTLFGITNMFVNPDAEYCRAKVTFTSGKSEEWFVSTKAVEKLSLQEASVQVLEKLSGAWFVGKQLTTPIGVKIPILPAKFVDPLAATGFVHSVPAHAPFDIVAIGELKKDKKTLEKYPGLEKQINGIKPISVISLEGFGEIPAQFLVEKMKISSTKQKDVLEKATKELYKQEFYAGKLNSINKQFSGMPVAVAKEKISSWLVAEGKAVFFYETSRPATCRCGGEVVAAVLSDQWFIDYNAAGWKEKARECLNEMTVFPDVYRKQFSDVFDWLDKRPCARRRGLGTQLPFNNEWIIESLSDSTIYMAFYTIIKSIRQHKISSQQLSPAFFDFVYLGKGDAKTVSKSTKISEAAMQEIRSEFLYWYPNDQRHTGIAHITNHLSFFIFAHTAIFEKRHWPKAISLNELVISEGSKMSKSKGNVVLLNKISSQVGADVFRLYSAGASDFGSVLDYRERDVEATKRLLKKFVAITTQMISSKNKPPKKLSIASKWFLSKFNSAVKASTLALQEFRLRDYVQSAFYSLLNDYDYFSRRATEEDKKAVASLVAQKWVALMAPVVPHVCEELWQQAGNKNFVSISQWPVAEEKMISLQAETEEDVVVSVLQDARKILQLLQSKGNKISSLKIIVCSEGKKQEFSKALKKETPEEAVKLLSSPESKEFLQKNFFDYRNKQSVVGFNEEKCVSSASDFISRELGLKVAVESEEKSSLEKKSKSMPLRPALVLQ